MRAGRHVVTANKQLLSLHGEELWSVAREHGVQLRFEAAVAGVVPVIRVLQESLAAAHIERVHGIVNGTTNYILSEMARTGATYESALADAQRLGYAEADPTDDVTGRDAAAKMAIIARLAFDTPVTLDQVPYEGIEHITADDMEYARELGLGLKLIGTAERIDGGISVRVHPAFLYGGHPLASVGGPFNAVTIESPDITEITMSGPGAGGPQTASAVLGDVISAMIPPASTPEPSQRLAIVEDVVSAFYLHLEVADRPGVLAQVAQILGMQGASIKSVVQKGLGQNARLVMVVHPLLESRLRAAVELIGRLEFLRSPPRAIRVIEEPSSSDERRAHRPLQGSPAVRGRRPGHHARRGLDAARARPARVRAGRRGGVAEARGLQPDRVVQGPRHDLRGVGRRPRGRGGRDLRVHGQHRRERRRLRGAGGAHGRRDRPRRAHRDRQARPGAHARRARRRAARQLRRGARARARAVREAPDRARQLRQPVPPRGPEDGGVRGRRRPRRRARRALHPGRQRGQRHRVVARLRRGGGRAPPVRLPGRGRRPARRGSPDRQARDDRQRDPDRQPGALGGGDGGDDGVARDDPRGDRRRDPRRLASARRARGRLLRARQRRVGGRAAALRRRRRRRGSSACSPATASRIRRPRSTTPAPSCRASRGSTPSSGPCSAR